MCSTRASAVRRRPVRGYAEETTALGFFEALAVQPDGSIVAVGSTTVQFMVSRFTAQGVFDPGFGCASPPCDGTLTFGDGAFSAVEVLADGKFLAGGSQIVLTGDNFAIARFESNGVLDSTYGTGGMTIGPDTDGRDMVVLADGSAVMAGFDEDTEEFVLAAFDADGMPDPDFGCASPPCPGVATGPEGFAFSIVRQPDGKFVVAGVGAGSSDGMFRVARYDANGVLDPTFGCSSPPCDGFVTGPAGPSAADGDRLFTDIALQADGKIVLAGNDGADPDSPNFLVARYTSQGVLDDEFGCASPPCDGIVIGPPGLVNGNGVVVQPDGRIIVGGASSDESGAFRVLRMDEHGALDPTFGCASPPCSGFVSEPGPGFGISLALQADLKILLSGGLAADFGEHNAAVARYLNPQPDPSGPTIPPGSPRRPGPPLVTIAPTFTG